MNNPTQSLSSDFHLPRRSFTVSFSLMVYALKSPKGEGTQNVTAYAASAKFSFAFNLIPPFLRYARSIGVPLLTNSCSRNQFIPLTAQCTEGSPKRQQFCQSKTTVLFPFTITLSSKTSFRAFERTDFSTSRPARAISSAFIV